MGFSTFGRLPKLKTWKQHKILSLGFQLLKLPKIENLKTDLSPGIELSTSARFQNLRTRPKTRILQLHFQFTGQISLTSWKRAIKFYHWLFNMWELPKNWKLERKIKSYLRVFNFGFQLWSWKLENQSKKLMLWFLKCPFSFWFKLKITQAW